MIDLNSLKTDCERWEAAVQLCLETNSDQPGYDRESAMAAVSSMLEEESGSYRVVLARLQGMPTW